MRNKSFSTNTLIHGDHVFANDGALVSEHITDDSPFVPSICRVAQSKKYGIGINDFRLLPERLDRRWGAVLSDVNMLVMEHSSGLAGWATIIMKNGGPPLLQLNHPLFVENEKNNKQLQIFIVNFKLLNDRNYIRRISGQPLILFNGKNAQENARQLLIRQHLGEPLFDDDDLIDYSRILIGDPKHTTTPTPPLTTLISTEKLFKYVKINYYS